MKYLSAALRLTGAFLSMIPFIPAYVAGAAWEALRQGWRAGRDDVKAMTTE